MSEKIIEDKQSPKDDILEYQITWEKQRDLWNTKKNPKTEKKTDSDSFTIIKELHGNGAFSIAVSLPKLISILHGTAHR
jgi:hypothetical protein